MEIVSIFLLLGKVALALILIGLVLAVVSSVPSFTKSFVKEVTLDIKDLKPRFSSTLAVVLFILFFWVVPFMALSIMGII